MGHGRLALLSAERSACPFGFTRSSTTTCSKKKGRKITGRGAGEKALQLLLARVGVVVRVAVAVAVARGVLQRTCPLRLRHGGGRRRSRGRLLLLLLLLLLLQLRRMVVGGCRKGGGGGGVGVNGG